jgi:hypothetical protein
MISAWDAGIAARIANDERIKWVSFITIDFYGLLVAESQSLFPVELLRLIKEKIVRADRKSLSRPHGSWPGV